MDRTTKFLKLLSKAERAKVEKVINLVLTQQTAELDVKKLTGYLNAYRVRIGDVRLIYLEHQDYNELLFVGRRSEKTYKKF